MSTVRRNGWATVEGSTEPLVVFFEVKSVGDGPEWVEAALMAQRVGSQGVERDDIVEVYATGGHTEYSTVGAVSLSMEDLFAGLATAIRIAERELGR